jgi:competence protein ComEC
VSSPLLIPCAAILAAIWLWPHWLPGAEGCLVGGALAAGLAALAARLAPGRLGWAALGLAGFLLGSAAPGLRAPGPALQGRVAVSGEVRAVSGRRAILALDGVGGRPARGRIEARFPQQAPPVGSRVYAFGRAAPLWQAALPGERDPALEARAAGLRSALSVSDALALGPLERCAVFAGSPREGVLRALLCGERGEVPEETLALLRDTGTRHLLAVSGLHVALFAGGGALLASALCTPLASRWPGGRLGWLPAASGAFAAWAFAAWVGWPVSARRAAAGLSLLALARATGRPGNPWNALAMAGAAVALHDPGAVRGLSFGLSFGAVAGILSIGLPLQRRLSPRLPRPLRWPLELCAISLGATAGALPLTAWTFQELALTAAVANLPAGALLAWWVLPAGALALWCPPLAGVALPAAEAGLAALEGWLALTRGPLLHPSVGPLGAAALGLAVLCARWPGRALGLAALALSLRSLPPGGELRVTFLAVGQGDAALIEDRGRRVLVDGGPGAWDVARYLRRRGLDRLDAVVLSHPHPDHMAGLPAVLEVADVGALWLPRPPRPGEDAFQALCDRARRLGVPLRYPGDEGLEVLHPSPDFLAATDDVNEGSLVFRVSLGRTRALFTGDIEALGEAALLAALSEDGPIEGPISWLKVPHHGSRTSSSAALVARLAPRVAVLSAAPDSRFGHPHPEVLRRYAGALALRTDRLGTVQLRSDGERESWRAWTPGRGWGGWREVPAGRAAPPEDAAPMAGWWPPSAPAPEGLHAVAYRGDPEQLAALLDAGADPRAPDPWGDTPIYLAIEGGNLDAARLLRWRGASLDVGRPPVCAAARFSRLEALEWLIGAGAPLAVSCYSGGPLHLAVAAGGDDPAVVEALLRAGADPRGRDERGRSPLELAEALRKPRRAAALRLAGP